MQTGEAIPNDPRAVIDDYAVDITVEELTDAALQYDEAWQVKQRLGGGGPETSRVMKDLLVEVGLWTATGEVPDDIEERAEAIKEAMPDA